MKIRVGKRIIKTAVTLFIILLIHIFLLWMDNIFQFDRNKWYAPSNMYTPFFAGIAAVYATHRDKKSSLKQAKIRSIGSIIGGYFGMLIVLLIEFWLITLTNLEANNMILYYLIRYIIVTLAIIPLIVITVKLKQPDAVFITCLTFLSVTISQRNGGMPAFTFATNRVLSTLIGVGVSLLVNNYIFAFKRVNKNVLFVSTLENNFLGQDDTLSAYSVYKLNELYDSNMPLIFATTRTPMSFEYIFKNVNINYPMITINGAAKYRFDKKEYSGVCNIELEDRIKIEAALKEKKMNAFTYTINAHILHAYHNVLKNDGEKKFYSHRKHQNSYSFVRGELPLDLNPSLYLIVDTLENIESFLNYCEENNVLDNLVSVVYKYRDDINGTPYYYLRIYNKMSNKENYVLDIMRQEKFSNLVVCASGRTVLKLLEHASFSMCLDSAPEHVKDKVNIVIKGTSDDVLRIFSKLYHSKDFNKSITKIKEKYSK